MCIIQHGAHESESIQEEECDREGFLEQMSLKSNLRGREDSGVPQTQRREGVFLAEVGPAGRASLLSPFSSEILLKKGNTNPKDGHWAFGTI